MCLTLATLIRIAYGAGLLDGSSGIRVQWRFSGSVPGGRGTEIRHVSVPGRGGDASRLEDGIRVRGGPDWVRSELYTIEAVAAGPADAQTMRGPMLRALLERRFGLKVHVETEQIPALKLTVAPGGLKMKEGICTKSETPSVAGGRAAQAAQSAAAVRRNLDAVRRGVPTTGRCGAAVALNGPNLLLVGAGSPVRRSPNSCRASSRPPIVDQTGIPETALFNFVLEFDPDGLVHPADEGIPRPDRRRGRRYADRERSVGGSPCARARYRPRKQLGLRLERVRAPREFIVIDAVERPAPN